MSVQFGKWNFDGKPLEPDYLDKVLALLRPYAPDGTSASQIGTACLAYGAFHSTFESQNDSQPRLFSSHFTMTWDGRLDNRSELILELRADLPTNPSDSEIVAAAYDRWGSCSFPKIVGDWALAIYDSRQGLLTLAKDAIGARPLYYSLDRNLIHWSTLLDPLVLLGDRKFALDREYVTGWITGFPAAHLTPYSGIRSLPAASFLEARPDQVRIRKYWDFDSHKRIRYRTDSDYEEHFRHVFEESVRRRLRSHRPVLAELSGGMDSSSIVAMADLLFATGRTPAPRLDTVSYYNDSEPNWNERPYFEKVEQKRGRRGCHITVDPMSSLLASYEGDYFAATPALACPRTPSSERFTTYVISNGHRVLLSGIAGDEVLGGVPNPMPELADDLLRGRFRRLAQQSVAWSLAQRVPLIELASMVTAAFLPLRLSLRPAPMEPPSWICPRIRSRYRAAFHGYDRRLQILGPLPSLQTNLITLDALRRRIASTPLSPRPVHEVRYPYLDRDFLEFLFAIPREQLLRPGERRSLVRRALRGMVPDEILYRKRKASAGRGLRLGLSNIDLGTEELLLATLGIVDAQALRENLYQIRQGLEMPLVFLLRTLQIERWLAHVARRGILELPVSSERLELKVRKPVEVNS
jgi:asparagine synthase (glutamine-hydrolysing)